MTPSLNVSIHNFTDGRALAVALAERVADRLRAGLVERDFALLAVSGGRTPLQFFDLLSQATLDWSRVQVTLVDERWVDGDDPRSNARLVREHLLQNAAAAARFVPLYTGDATPEEGQPEAGRRVHALPLPFDAVVLGMGLDGHTASFFPGGDQLEAALDLNLPNGAVPMRAPGAGEPRITLTLSTLLETRHLFLHIEGEAKRDVLAQARLGGGDAAHYPVRAVLERSPVPLAVYWCP
ncbi:6-phosphogluconolactonase [Frateuria sp. STR12]|uniref:6-phosphogluconolactonase n=1 Tax=Frateuria hangzhouensis TaxID=2995589 RepID=UPI002260B3DF|nr:6-phosphogluconolactonase [Frateuria sp. STR12]MCX7513284.1 6-phosphogluconolactonase [Frateuria sp. STR12]